MIDSAAKPMTIEAALAEAASRLSAAGIDESRLEVRLLAAHALGIDIDALIGSPSRPLQPEEAERFAALLRRRLDREPIAYILGEREFWSLGFRVTEAVLIPRPDSETLVEAALGHCRDRQAKLRILDLGTGSGCLLLALLSEMPNAHGVGVDIAADALAVAQDNARRLGLSARTDFVQGDWATGLTGSFDVILANPPYLALAEKDGLAPDVRRFEPHLALFAGSDGLDCYRAFLPQLGRLLSPAGAVFVEIGMGQAPRIGDIARQAGLTLVAAKKDLAGIARCLVLRRP